MINGNYEVLCGNGYEMLQHSIGTFNGEDTLLNKNEIYTTNFKNGVELMGIRSPHVTMSNILLTKNTYKEKIDTYFNSTNEIVHINSVKENILSVLSGCDYDGDHMMVTDNKILIDIAKLHYDKFLVPTDCIVNKNKVEYSLTPESRCELDVKTSVNKIGEIINLSQYLNSYYWDRFNNKSLGEDKLKRLFELICELDVLSCIEIDKAKKPSVVDSNVAMDNIRKEAIDILGIDKIHKPLYFKEKNKEEIKTLKKELKEKEKEGLDDKEIGDIEKKLDMLEDIYLKFDTSLDYLIEKMRCRNFKFKNKINDMTPIEAFFKVNKECLNVDTSITKSLVNNINKISDDYSKRNKSIYSELIQAEGGEREKYIKEIEKNKNEYNNKISKLKLKSTQIASIIFLMDRDANKNKEGKEGFEKAKITKEKRALFNLIYLSHKKEVKNIFRNNKKKLPRIEADKDGDIDLFGVKFKAV
ncbi:MAG: hypothetical protein ACRC28_00935 [Clostridium sp.]|uniref:hypothetical protein n=1 Tax=Clostridia TaxID=186801 RepID=UPI003F2FC8CC